MAAPTTTAKPQAATSDKRGKAESAASPAAMAARARAAGRSLGEQAEEIEENLTRGAEDLAANVSNKLKSVGVDTDRMVEVAREQAGDLEELIMREIRERPLRALGVAAAVGLFVGFLSAR
jgi:ElaB/YqjD/DUF883 family membrane-anchored ribosome-binding protein